MKKKLLLLFPIVFALIFPGFQTQAQSGFSYQAVARDNTGNPIADHALTLRIEIQTFEGTEVLWQEDHDVTTNSFGLFTITVGGTSGYAQAGTAENFDAINWSENEHYMNVKIKTDGDFIDMGSSPILTVPLASYAKRAKNSSGNFSVQAEKISENSEALFEVKRSDGSVAFAVYEDMVWVYVDTSDTKGVKGGFAVGGYNSGKSSPSEFMRVTPDSIRLFINTDPSKGRKGGFAVGGYNSAKSIENEFLRVTPDSTRIYINTEQTKGIKGGFAVGGYSTGKSLNDDYLFVSGKQSVDIVNDKAQILWYPLKEAFLAGNIYIPHPDSVGQNSTALGFRSQARGNWSQAFGYKSYAMGDYSTAIGREAVSGFSSFAFGNRAKAMGNISYALGSGSEASGPQSFALGVNSMASNEFSTSLGFEATASGQYATAIGFKASASGNSSFSAGRLSDASAQNSIAFGNGAISSGLDAASIGYKSQALGEKSIAIGSFYSYTFSNLPYFNISGKKNDAKSDFEFILWDPIISPLFRTISFSRANIAEGKYSISIGNGNYSNNGGMALGSNNDAIAFGSVALGISNKSKNTNSFSAGYSSTATGYYATAIGNNAFAKSYGSFVIGQYNEIAGDSSQWRNIDPLFVVGNGLNNDNRNNALTVYKSGRSIFKGADANITLNDRRSIFFPSSSTTVYGIRAYINRDDPAVNNYYSGYFYDIGTEGTYQGFYIDVRSGSSADVAEYIYDTRGNTEPGDVLVADPDIKESVIVSSEPYQSAVLGVVSTDPHLVMGMDLIIDEETGATKPGVQATRLALTGRVPCKVTDENGAIKPGDLLTTSSTPGHAMKWTPIDVNQAEDFNALKEMLSENEQRRNAIVGKALEAHQSGEGKILVLISLQ